MGSDLPFENYWPRCSHSLTCVWLPPYEVSLSWISTFCFDVTLGLHTASWLLSMDRRTQSSCSPSGNQHLSTQSPSLAFPHLLGGSLLIWRWGGIKPETWLGSSSASSLPYIQSNIESYLLSSLNISLIHLLFLIQHPGPSGGHHCSWITQQSLTALLTFQHFPSNPPVTLGEKSSPVWTWSVHSIFFNI